MLRGVNGSGGGAPVGGSGTTNTIPRWTGASTLGDSGLTDDGTTIKASRPTWILNVNGFRVSDGGTTNFARLSQSGAYSILDGLAPSGQVWIRTNAGATLAIAATDTGNVGIGTTSPSSLGTNYTTLDIRGSAGGGIRMGTPSIMSYMYADSSGYNLATSTALPIILYTNNAERARIDSSGNFILNTATTGATIQAAGSQQGLKLPATPGSVDAQTLDCYQDGGAANSGGVTWTPELRFGGATTGIAYNFRAGRYTRIGNMIFAQAHITLSSKGTATGNATVAGLPTMSNTADLYAAASIGYLANLTIGAQATGLMFQNSSQVTLYKSVANANPTNMADTDFANNSVLIFTICYPVT